MYKVLADLQLTPKLSASVAISLINPLHCLYTLPILWPPSADETWKQWQQKKTSNII